MPKETTAGSNESGLIQLKYAFGFREKFDEPDDDWLKCIEATIDELLGTYSKAEDNALSAAFGGRCHTRISGHQDPGANIITRCAGTKSHTYDESWHMIECHIFTL
jgi:hypothetical protein